MEYRIDCDYCMENGNGNIIVRCKFEDDRNDILDFLEVTYPDAYFKSINL